MRTLLSVGVVFLVIVSFSVPVNSGNITTGNEDAPVLTSGNISTIDNIRDLETMRSRLEERFGEAFIYTADDDGEIPGVSVAEMMLANPGKPVIIRESNRTGLESVNTDRDRAEIYTKWLENNRDDHAVIENAALLNKETMAEDDLLAGGSGSLDRLTVLTFIFVEGNGSACFDWTPERLVYSLNSAIQVKNKIIQQADSFNIMLGISAAYIYQPINFEPYNKASGRAYGASLDINGLDDWRSAALDSIGFEPNLRGLYTLNKTFKGYAGSAEGAVCFVVNFDDSNTSQYGEYADWAAGWIETYRVGKPYCTVSFNTVDSAILDLKMEHEILHLFGAMDEYFSDDCVDASSCDNTRGKLLGENLNCIACGPQLPCVMRGGSDYLNVCHFTAKQIGWLDSDEPDNGGSDVDDIPVDYTGLVTGQFELGDKMTIRTIDGDFVNSFVVSSYNSYANSGNQRTVQVLGANYLREKIAPGIYYGSINNGDPFTILINLDNDHAPLEIQSIAPNGPEFRFTAQNVGHLNLEVRDFGTSESYPILAGHLMAGSGTIYSFFPGEDWFPDGQYQFRAFSWCCDGVNYISIDTVTVNYGPPEPWVMDLLTFDMETDRANAYWTPSEHWTTMVQLLAKGNVIYDFDLDEGCPVHAGWEHHIGSDSVNVGVMAYNANGSTYSNEKSFITQPNPPYLVSFNPVFKGDRKINAIAVHCSTPYGQILSQLSYYEVKAGCYIHMGGGYYDYDWTYSYFNAPTCGGGAYDTLWNLHPNSLYSINIKTHDKRGLESGWAFEEFDTITVGGEWWDPAEFPENVMIEKSEMPTEFSLGQNSPNPFNPSTVIHYSVPLSSEVTINIYDILGRLVKTLVNKNQSPGWYSVEWNGTDALNKPVASGMYLYEIDTGVFRECKKMILIR